MSWSCMPTKEIQWLCTWVVVTPSCLNWRKLCIQQVWQQDRNAQTTVLCNICYSLLIWFDIYIFCFPHWPAFSDKINTEFLLKIFSDLVFLERSFSRPEIDLKEIFKKIFKKISKTLERMTVVKFSGRGAWSIWERAEVTIKMESQGV